MPPCLCLTKAGQQCKNQAKPNSKFCGVHLNCQMSVQLPMKIPLSKKKQEPTDTITIGTLKDSMRVYEGQLLDGVPHGQGKMTFTSDSVVGVNDYKKGDVYVGHFQKGIFSGEGEITNPNGRHMKGNFVNGDINGFGIYNTSEFQYKGDFADSKPDGKGEIKWPDGSHYQGDLKNGLMDGHGTYTDTNKSQYTGQMKLNQLDGIGKMNYSQGGSYEGSWLKDQYNGPGVLITTDGAKYEGSFINNLLSGPGTLTTKYNDILKGSFTNGVLSGPVIKIQTDGSIIKGLMTNGKFTGPVTLTRNQNGQTLIFSGKCSTYGGTNCDFNPSSLKYSNGTVFTGKFEADYTDYGPSEGILQYPNGNIYEGEVYHDQPHGEGQLKIKDVIYKGQFEKGIFNGLGQMILPNHKTLIGDFKNWKLTKGQVKSNLGYLYTGQLQNNQMHGLGHIIFYSGNVSFKGHFDHDKLGSGSWENLPSQIQPVQLQGLKPEQILPILLLAYTEFQVSEAPALTKLKKVTTKVKSNATKLNLGLSNQKFTEWQKICQSLSKDYKLPELQSIAKTFGINTQQPKRKLCQLIAIEVNKCTNDTDLLGDEINESEPHVFHYQDPQTHINYCFTENDAPYFKDKNLNPYNKQPFDNKSYAQIKAFMKLPVQDLVVTPAMNSIFDESGLPFDFEQRKNFVFLVQMTNTFPEFKNRPDNTFPITPNNEPQWLFLYTQIQSLIPK